MSMSNYWDADERGLTRIFSALVRVLFSERGGDMNHHRIGQP
jgi:hypothetical protein